METEDAKSGKQAVALSKVVRVSKNPQQKTYRPTADRKIAAYSDLIVGLVDTLLKSRLRSSRGGFPLGLQGR